MTGVQTCALPIYRSGFIDWRVRSLGVIGSPGLEFDEAAAAELAGRAYDRDHDRLAMVRQSLAVLASGDRTARLRSLQVPALVVHGASDRMVDVSGGRATAAAIPGAELVIFDGMGHSLPEPLWPKLADLIAGLVHRAEAAPA